MKKERQNNSTWLDTRTLVLMGILIAMQVVLARFASINAWNIRIGFGFVPVMFASMYLGPLYGGVVGGVADFLGSMLFPSGAYFPGFTATAFLTGVIFGMFMHERKNPAWIVAGVVVNQIVVSLCFNTLWISILYGSSYFALLSTRLLQALFYVVVQIVVGVLLERIPVRRFSYQ